MVRIVGLVAAALVMIGAVVFLPRALLERAIAAEDAAFAAEEPGPPAPEVLAVALSSDGRRLAVGGKSARILLLDAETGAHTSSLELEDDWVTALGWSAQGRWVGGVGHRGRARIWDATTGAPVYGSPAGAHATALAFKPIGPTVVWGDRAGTLQVVHLEGQRNGGRFIGLQGEAISSIAFTSDGGRLAVGTEAGTIALFEVTSGGLLWTAPAHRGAVTGVSVPPDTDLLITSGHDGAVRVWSMGLAPELANERVPIRGRWLASAVLGGHERFVAGGTDGALHAWTFAGEQSVDTAPGGWTRSISASATGDRFVTGGGDRVLVWRGVDLALERTISVGSELVAP